MRRATSGALQRLLLRPSAAAANSLALPTPAWHLNAMRALTHLQSSSGTSSSSPLSYASLSLALGASLCIGFAAAGHAQAAAKKAEDPHAKANAAKPKTPEPAAAAAAAASPGKLPSYTREEVSKHKDPSSGVWVIYKGGVYDITEFIEAHPGGKQKIMLAAGSSIEPFWAMYKQHNKDEVREILSQYKIGDLVGGGADVPVTQIEDPFKKDPERHPALMERSAKPFNGETPGSLLAANIITPTELFYVRNHLAVPEVDLATWRLKIEGEGLRTVELTMEQLQTLFKKHVMAATIQCGGNRRNEMKQIKTVKGLDWDQGAIGTATFAGVLLKDVLRYAGLSDDEPGVEHVHFVGLDRDPLTGEVYHVSIPVSKATDPAGDVLLAYEMNGAPLTRDHGFPLRAVTPGLVGARNCKWLTKIVTSSEESSSFWQQRDYKGFSPGVDWDSVDWGSAPAIQEMPVTSAVCEPTPGSEVYKSDGSVTVKGYAWSGGGRAIVRAEVSADGGKTWHVAALKKLPQRPGRAWAWCLWEVEVPLPPSAEPGSTLKLICRAVDDSYNVQPDSVTGVWNLRGVLNNAWHGVELKVVE